MAYRFIYLCMICVYGKEGMEEIIDAFLKRIYLFEEAELQKEKEILYPLVHSPTW